MDRKDIHNYISRTTVYRTIQKLEKLNLIKAEVDKEYEKRFNTNKNKKKSTNRFNNYSCRNYTKEDFEEYEKIFFN